jgi:hypothetical protein
MLTADLVRARTVKGRLRPAFVNAEDPQLLDRAAELVGMVQQGKGESRGELEEMLDGWIGDDPDAKLLRGLWHLVEKRCTFEVHAPLPPPLLRMAVFRESSKRGPLATKKLEGGPPTVDDIYAVVAAEHGVPAEKLPAALYADHPDAMRLTAVEFPEDLDAASRWLLHRYNSALVQGILISASSLTIHLQRPEPPRARQLFRAIKFHQLIHTIVPEGDSYRIVLDGPTSLFSQTSRYGMALARFFPALLLQTGGWTLEAPVIWRDQPRILEVDHTLQLQSHYKDVGGWVPKEAEWFAERFTALNTGWELVRQPPPLRVGDVVIVPDFGFRKDGKEAWLEILGFWRKSSLARRREQLRQPGAENLLLAVSRRLCGDDETELTGVLPFAEVIPAKEVLKWVEAHAR